MTQRRAFVSERGRETFQEGPQYVTLVYRHTPLLSAFTKEEDQINRLK